MNIVVFGSSGAIGHALIEELSRAHPDAIVYAVAHHQKICTKQNIVYYHVDYDNEASIAELALKMEFVSFDIVIVATGLLHHEKCMPEKSVREISATKFHLLFSANTVLPALIAKHFGVLLKKSELAIFAVLSARIGSISDNRLGGWYSYRASKAALNMIIKNLAIEFKRTLPYSVFIGLHPGTVDSRLSKPFHKSIPIEKIFTPAYAAERLIKVLEKLTTQDTGKIFAWDGQEISP